MSIISVLIISILGVVLIYQSVKSDNCFASAIIGGIIGIVICSELHEDQPQAIDVYRGNTELQITYKGDVATDTVVVFKDEYKR